MRVRLAVRPYVHVNGTYEDPCFGTKARLDALRWLGGRYLCATSINRRDHESDQTISNRGDAQEAPRV